MSHGIFPVTKLLHAFEIILTSFIARKPNKSGNDNNERYWIQQQMDVHQIWKTFIRVPEILVHSVRHLFVCHDFTNGRGLPTRQRFRHECIRLQVNTYLSILSLASGVISLKVGRASTLLMPSLVESSQSVGVPPVGWSRWDTSLNMMQLKGRKCNKRSDGLTRGWSPFEHCRHWNGRERVIRLLYPYVCVSAIW